MCAPSAVLCCLSEFLVLSNFHLSLHVRSLLFPTLLGAPCGIYYGLLCPLISFGFSNGRNGGRRVRSIHLFMWLLHCGVATIWLDPCLEGHNSYQAPSSQRSRFLWV